MPRFALALLLLALATPAGATTIELRPDAHEWHPEVIDAVVDATPTPIDADGPSPEPSTFHPMPAESTLAGARAIWVSLELRNAGDEPRLFYVSVSRPQMDAATWFVPPRAPVRLDQAMPWESRASPVGTIVWPITLAPQETLRAIGRLWNDGGVSPAIDVRDAAAQASFAAERWFGVGAHFAGVLVLALLAIAIGAASGVRAFYAFALSGVLVAIGVLNVDGTLHRWLSPVASSNVHLFAWCSATFCDVVVIDALFELRRRRPRALAVLVGLAFAQVLVVVLWLTRNPLVWSVQLPVRAMPYVLACALAVDAVIADRRRFALSALPMLVLAVHSSLVARHPATDGGMIERFGALVFFVTLGLAMLPVARRVFTDRQKALEARVRLADALTRYVPSEFLALLGKPSIVDVGRGDRVEQEMTIAFSDVRGFTTLAEKLSPDATFAVVNDYLAAVVPALHEHGGFVDKYIGDAVMALFAPGEKHDGPDRAVAAAVAQLAALERFNQGRAAPLAVGTGIHTGPLVLGIVGSDARLNATVLGDSVNLASRLEGLTKLYGASVLLSGEARARLTRPWRLRLVDRVKVKGKSAPVTVYEVLDGRPDVEARVASTPRFEAAREAFGRGELDVCESEFRAMADAGDRAATLYLERCARLRRDGVPAGWDGVVALDEK